MARHFLMLLLALALGPLAGAARAQSDPLAEPRLEPVGDTRSINDGVVTALVQDDVGLIWIGTTIGLVRYDGYQLRPLQVGGGPAGANSSFVRALLAAPAGVLWLGLEGEGLARLDTASQQWTRYRPDATRPGALAAATVRALAQGRDGVLWVGTTGGGLHSLAPGASDFTHYRHGDGALADDRVQALLVDRRGDLWVGTWNGLQRRRQGSTHFEAVLGGPAGADSLAGRTVSMLGQAPDGRLWVGTRTGDLLIIDPDSGAGLWVERSSEAAGGNVSAVLAMAVRDAGEVWIGRDNGVELRAAGSGRLVKHLRRDLLKPWSLGGNNVVALLRDTSGGMWTGSYGGGLQRHSSGPGLWVRRGEGAQDSVLAEADARSLAQLRNGQIWVGTTERGVAVLDAQLRLIGEIRPDGTRAHGFAGGQVGAIAQARDGTVWVGADTGIYAFDAQRKLLARYRAGQGRARRMLATRDGRLWVGTQDGVYRRDAGQARFERATLVGGAALGGNINALVEAADGSVWVGGTGGLFHTAAGQAALQQVVSPKGAGLLKPHVLGLLVDRQQVLWVDTYAGLHRLLAWDGRLAQFKHYADPAGVPGRGSIGANLLDDAQGRIWTHQTVFDPRDGSRHELSRADGVDIGTGWFRSYTALADGRLLFGGSAGLLVVEPARFKPWTYAPAVVVSELRVDGERVATGALQSGLRLDPRRRSFSVEFAALDFSHADRYRYRYRLQGLDADWVETGADFRVASYGNLPPGSYTLHVQASNHAGDWGPNELSLKVEVVPAWWQTWWAQALGAALLAALLWAVVQLRTRMLRRQQTVLERRVSERTEALEVLSQQLRHKSQALEASALTDPLTGLHNRRFLAQHIEADVAHAVRRSEAQTGSNAAPPDDADLVFFLIDIDHFKQVNDLYGHAAGDAVLVQMRERLQQAFRQGDHLVRWGGEEFLIAARATSRHRAAELAERARAIVADTPFVLDDGSLLHRTCSVGFAAFPPAPAFAAALDWTAVVDIADAALYKVKRSGRNGWLGLVTAQAESAAALRAAAAQALDAWVASGALQMAHSVGLLDTDPAASFAGTAAAAA